MSSASEPGSTVPFGAKPEDAGAVAALADAVASGDFDSATRVVALSWFPLLRSHGDQVRELLSSVPFSRLRSHPLLAALLGVTYYGERHRRPKALQYFAIASIAARPRNARISEPERALILAGESAGLRIFGQHARAIGPARAALRVLDSMVNERSALIGHLPGVYSQLGMALYYGGYPLEALEAFSLGLAEAGPTDNTGFGNLAMLAGMHALDGDIPAARDYVTLARGPRWTDEQRARYNGTFYRIAEAVIALEEFDTDGAQSHLDVMSHDLPTIEHWVPLAQTEAMTALLSRGAADGLARLESVVIARGSDGRTRARSASLASIRALLHLALGSVDAASEILRRDAPSSPQTNVDRARVSLVGNRTGDALREIRAIAGAPQTSRTAAQACAIEASVLLRVSSTGAARAAVDRLGALLRGTGQRTALALLPSADLDRVRSALAEQGHVDLFDGVDIRSALADVDDGPALTPREREVLKMLEHTGSTAQIASGLFVSVNTVKSQLRSLYRKLGVTNREDAIAVALARRLLIDDED